MKIRIFLIAVMCMMLLAIGMNTRNIAAHSFDIVPITNMETLEKAMQSVVDVIGENGGGGSGFYIGNGIIVTAGHIAKIPMEKVIFENSNEYNVLKQIVCPDYDCGFLLIEDNDQPVLKFDNRKIKRGEEIFILGNPSGLNFIVTKGIVGGYTTLDGFFGDVLLVVVDAAAHYGNSGSVLLSKDGKILGVWVGGRISRCGAFLIGCSVSVRAEDILKALEQAGLSIE